MKDAQYVPGVAAVQLDRVKGLHKNSVELFKTYRPDSS